MVRFIEENITKMLETKIISNSEVLYAGGDDGDTSPATKVFQDFQINDKNVGGGGGLIRSWVDSMRACSPTHLQSFNDQSSWIMRNTVRKLAMCFPTAIVSGRCREKVYSFVKLTELYYAGSHGMDIKGPEQGSRYKKKNQSLLCQPATEFLPVITEVYRKLVEKTNSIPGAKVENNKFCASVHFRCVDENKWSDLAHLVRSVLKNYPKLMLTQGRKVFEIRPIIKWDKGKALEFLLESLGYDNCTDVFPIYIGDDRTDEDAFKILRDKRQGLGILVMSFLERLVVWKQLTCGA
ncbi:unnamed protein product [Thlaspi arvense]|uniref:Trehalose 6-phosphate phosphatase n=1 Tax=Thlaspi arvense TaxID=13288 RepID=A0AAU9SCS0_THLAR|nr:unnamed protein product [Thlaspi arvense]